MSGIVSTCRGTGKTHIGLALGLAAWWTNSDSCRCPKTGAEMLFEVFSQRYERTSTLVTSNLPFAEWTEVLGSERLTGALLDRLTHHVHILEMNGDSFRLKNSRKKKDPGPQ